MAKQGGDAKYVSRASGEQEPRWCFLGSLEAQVLQPAWRVPRALSKSLLKSQPAFVGLCFSSVSLNSVLRCCLPAAHMAIGPKSIALIDCSHQDDIKVVHGVAISYDHVICTHLDYRSDNTSDRVLPPPGVTGSFSRQAGMQSWSTSPSLGLKRGLLINQKSYLGKLHLGMGFCK